MTDLTHTELVEKVADIIDPKSKGPMREYRITQRELAESLATEIVSTIAEALKEPTEAMVSEGDELFPFARGTESHAMSGGLTPEKVFRAMLTASPLHEEKA